MGPRRPFYTKAKTSQTGPYTTYDTPQRAKVQGTIEYLKAKGFPPNKTDIFDFFGVKERTGWDIVKPGAEARTRHNRDINETRGRNYKLSGADVREADHLLEEVELGLDTKGMGWLGLVWELDFDVHSKTLLCAML